MDSVDNQHGQFNTDALVQLARNLNRLMDSQKITAEELARDTGVHQATISGLRNGRNRNPCLDTLIKLAQALETSLAELFAGVGPMGNPLPQYLTFSEWFWTTFVHLMGKGVLLEPEDRLHDRFEAFLKAVRPDAKYTPEDLEGIWRDRRALGYDLPTR